MIKPALCLAAVLAACSTDARIAAPPPVAPAPALTTVYQEPPTSLPKPPTPTTVEEVIETTTTTEVEVEVTVVTVAPAAKRQPTTTVYSAPSSDLASIRACESESDYSTDTGNGYYGAYQFHPDTWASVGGSGNPADASSAEQDMRAQMMIDAGRRSEWPNC